MTMAAFSPKVSDSIGRGENASFFASDGGRDRLQTAIRQLQQIAKENGYSPIEAKTVAAALLFVEHLPFNRRLPKIAAEDDGSITLMWRDTNRLIKLAVTISHDVLSAVVNPGARSTHLPDVIFGGYIPPAILDHVPAKQ